MTQELENLAAKLLEIARKLPPGMERHDILKEIGRLRAQISTARVRSEAKAERKKLQGDL